MKKYYVLKISRESMLYKLSEEGGWCQDRNQGETFSYDKARSITDFLNRSCGSLGKFHFNFIECKD